MERIETLGYSEVLADLAKRIKGQQLCEAILKSHREESLVKLNCHDDLWWYDEGIVRLSSSVLAKVGRDEVIEVDTASHKLLRVNGESVSGISNNQELLLKAKGERREGDVLLKATGERWEGDTLNSQPYGWGVLTDGNNKRVYEGFRIGGMNVCYGILYNRDSQKAEYEGGICNGKRWGRGTEYDRNGNPVYDGEWLDDRRIEKQIDVVNDSCLLHNHVEDLIVSDQCCNGREWKTLDFSHMPCLRVFCVGDFCFGNVEEVRLIGLKKLTRVVIGMGSFRQYEKCNGRRFLLKDCKRIRELRIGNESFYYYSVCEIQNVDSLEEIEIGGTNDMNLNFELVSRFELKSSFHGVQ